MKNVFVLITLGISSLGPLQSSIAQTPTKYVVIEEATGMWCTYCPRGEVIGLQLAEMYQEVIIITAHANDPIAETTYPSAGDFPFYPSGRVDRTHQGVDPTEWEAYVLAQLQQVAPASIGIVTTWDPQTRVMTMTLEASMAQDLTGDHRLMAVVVENGITGPSPDFDQANDFAGGGQGVMGGYELLPDPVPAAIMVYQRVARHLPGGYMGLSGSLPTQLTNGASYSYTYVWVVPVQVNEDHLKVVGMLIDATSGEILNAGESNYLNGSANAAPFFHSAGNSVGTVDNIYESNIVTHDPDGDPMVITSSILPAWATLVDNGNGTGLISGVPQSGGVFDITLEVSDGVLNEQQEFQITVTGMIGLGEYGSDENGLSVYPNPNHGSFSIDSEIRGVYRIMDAAGRVVANGNMKAGTTRLELALLPGTYSLEVVGDRVVRKTGFVCE